MTCAPDEHFAALREFYEDDPRFTVPATVYNAVRQQREPLEPSAD